MITVYISIGNSDDKLEQVDWAMFLGEVFELLDPHDPNVEDSLVTARHGVWFSEPMSPWQNACWCVEVEPEQADELKDELGRLAGQYRQESIAWAEAQTTFIAAKSADG